MITVKFLSKLPNKTWLRLFPNDTPIYNNCRFIFDKNETVYDWLVVYDDTPSIKGERFSNFVEHLKCPKEHSLLITQEPHTIKIYGTSFTDQFGIVLTSQTEQELPHSFRIYSQPALLWFYGMGSKQTLTNKEILLSSRQKKNRELSVIWSNKKQIYTSLFQRYKFLHILKQEISDLDIFGVDHNDLDDKSTALIPYRYHIAIENHVGKHHWTEKISDAFLGEALPFYHGCPNLSDYFPEKSYIRINIFDIDKSIKIINDAIKNNEYEKRLSYIQEARQKIIEDYNLFNVISKIINDNNSSVRTIGNHFIYSRRSSNTKNILVFIKHQCNKYISRLRYALINFLSCIK